MVIYLSTLSAVVQLQIHIIQFDLFKEKLEKGQWRINSSPVPSLGWSILYCGVEYKSRQTGPFSVVTKSNDVPLEMGTACKPSSQNYKYISVTEQLI